MIKSIIDYLEAGNNKKVNWFVRFQDIFFGIVLNAGGFILSAYGIFLLFTKSYSSGIVLVAAGFVNFVLLFIRRQRSEYEHKLSIVSTVVLACTIIAFLIIHDADLHNILFANILSVIFPLIGCVLLHIKRGTFASIAVLLITLVSGLFFINYEIFAQIAFFLAGIFVWLSSIGFIIIANELVNASDTKITDIQKETEIKNKFISQLSYQIRTPLSNIIGVGNLLNETQLNQRQKDWLETIIASANNLISVVNIVASSVTSFGIVNTKSASIAFNMQSIMDNVIQLYVGQSDEYNIGLKPNMEAQYNLEGDPIQIKQIFMTLIDTIIANKKADKINIFVSYRIVQATERLYDVNFEIKVSDQLDFDTENEKSAEMLNFSISSRLIAMTGNKLNVTYENNFTIFSFKLSFNKSTETEIKNVPSAVSAEKVEKSDTSTTRDTSKVDLKDANILLVEDNLINQKIVILSIQKLVKSINIANNGLEAVEKFSAGKHDIILMDLQMPVMDGIQATKKIREIEMEKRIIPTPIIAITANALAGDREHCLASGMDEYISKPFQVEMLVGKMKHLLAIGSSMYQ